ncbi:MAG TPA: tetratricopeptide repeat protein [Thermoanaerobaculia bacterium]|nr:tetratricopeptide repeat protein [Thermoanaerobaculia bacterium]
MEDRHVTERELGLVAPWVRALTLTLVILPWAVAGVDAANAQTTGASDNPSAYLAAPADGVDFYLKSETAARLLDEKKWPEAEALLLELTRAYPLSSAWATNHSNWGRLGMALRQQGKHAAAIEAYKKVIERQGPGLAYPGPSNARYWIAASYAALGNSQAALDTLEEMAEEDHYLAKPDLLDDPNLTTLKDSPRFRSIAGKADVSGLDRTEGWRRDIDYLIAELKRSNPPGAAIPSELFRRASDLQAAVPKLNDHQIAMGIERVMNALDRGHTALWVGDPSGGAKIDFRPLPIRLYAFPEGIFITETGEGAEGLAGAQVLAFGNTAAAEALQRVGASISTESAMEILWQGPQLLVRPGVLKGLGIIAAADRAELTLRMPDGRTATKTLSVRDETPPTDWSRRLNAPPNVPAPLFLGQIRENHWFQVLPDQHAIFVQVNNIRPDEDETMPQFGLRLRQAIADGVGGKPRHLILDIRHNNGGNSFQYVELLRTLVAFSAGEGQKVYVLIGRNVYSAAANLSTDLERLVRPVFVGEPTSGTGNQWGDESRFILPYSGLTGAFSGVRWQLSNPWDERRSIVPQVPVQLTAGDYFAGRDPALDAVFRLIRESEAEPPSR